MKSKWFLNLALAVLAVALGVYAYLMPRENERGTFALSMQAARDVTAIRIERSANPATVLERAGGQWRLTAPFVAPAEPPQVERLLAILSARSPQRMPPVELARFDLDAPPLRVTFNTQAFAFGLVSPVTREQFVLTGGAVHVIAPSYGAGVPVDPAQLVQRRLFADGAIPAKLTVPGASLTRDAAGWHLTPPRAGLSQEDLKRFADDWRLASAARVARAGARPMLATIEVGFEDRSTVTFEVVQHEPELVLRRRELGLEYSFTGGSARRLLGPRGFASP